MKTKSVYLLLILCLLGNLLSAQVNTYTTNRTSTQITPSTIATKWFNGTDSTNLGVGFSSNFQTVGGKYNTALGAFTLSFNTNGFYNTAIGYKSMEKVFQSNNTAIGSHSMLKSTNSSRNVAIGFKTMEENLVSNDNVAIGHRAMNKNQYGSFNVAIGQDAHYGSTIDSLNVAIGSLALSNVLNSGPGSKNVAIGAVAMSSGGTEAVAIGNYAGANFYQEGVTIGAFSQRYSGTNTAIGDSVMAIGNNLKSNTAIGHAAMKNSSLFLVGGLPDAKPEENVAIGSYALMGVGGRRNVAIGNSAMRKATLAYENVAIGNGSMINFTNSFLFGNTAIGDSSMVSMTAAKQNTSLGYLSGKGITTGNQNTIIGTNVTVNTPTATNLTIIASNYTGGGSNKVILGNTSVSSIGGYAAFSNYSDKRLKTDILTDKTLGLDFVMGLKTATYRYKEDSNELLRNGLIAQDLEKLCQELGVTFDGLNIDDDLIQTRSIAYDKLVIPLINAHQELAFELDILSHKYEKLKAKNEELSQVKEKIIALQNQQLKP